MKIRYLSGNLTGCVEEVEQIVGEQACQFGFAELVPEPERVVVLDEIHETPTESLAARLIREREEREEAERLAAERAIKEPGAGDGGAFGGNLPV